MNPAILLALCVMLVWGIYAVVSGTTAAVSGIYATFAGAFTWVGGWFTTPATPAQATGGGTSTAYTDGPDVWEVIGVTLAAAAAAVGAVGWWVRQRRARGRR